MATNARYGYFRRRTLLPRVQRSSGVWLWDLAPLIAWLARGSRVILVYFAPCIRLLPALAFGAEIALTGFLPRELGGRKWGHFPGMRFCFARAHHSRQWHTPGHDPLEPLFGWAVSTFFSPR